MGVQQSQPKRKLEEIERGVRLIRSNLRASNRRYSKEIKNNIHGNLVEYSNEASELKGKVKNKQLDSVQKNISLTMKEVLTMDSDLDTAAVETDSIVQVPHNRKTLSLERPKNGLKMRNQSKSLSSLTNSPNLKDIENKLKTLKSQIKIARQSQDTTQLRVYQQTLKVLATSLEIIDVPEYTPTGDKKNNLKKMITSQYQTINKTLREMKRNRDIKYLTKLKKKDSATKALEIIKRMLEKYDALSREAVKSGDKATVIEVQQNLMQLKQRINSVESIDDNTKTMKLNMEDKISWLTKVILESSQEGSQPDLSRAQDDYEEIIKNIASGRNKSDTDLKEKLEKLQTFTNSISSLSDENDRKKKQLLSNINESLTTFNSNENRSKKSTINIESQESSLTSKLTDFVNFWDGIETALKSSSLSERFYQQEDNVLQYLHHSIGETRIFLKNQQRKFNGIGLSIPNTTEDNNGNNTTTGERNIGKSENLQLATTDNKLVHYLHTGNARQEETRFSRINEIRTQVYYIKEKLETSIQKPNLKTKLEDYIRILEEYIKSDNEVIAKSARILIADIYDVIKNIDHSISKYVALLPLEYYMDIIFRMEDNVAKLERQAKNFQAERNDTGYQDAKRLLIETMEYLETFQIPLEYGNANEKKLEVLKTTGEIIDQCEKEYLKREEAYVKEVKKMLETLGDRITRFNGPFKGVIYNGIEKHLNKILIDADANVTDKLVLDEVIKKTEKYLKILESRAIKNQNIGQPITQAQNEKMSAVKGELQDLKNDIDHTPKNAINIFIGLNSRLDLIKLSLDQLKNLDENSEHQKEIIYNEIETLKNVVEDKIALGQQDNNQTCLEEFTKKATEEYDRRVNEELDKIELTFLKLREDIKNFTGTKSDKKYHELDESSMRLILEMDHLKLPKGSQLYDRKIELLKQIHEYENFLEKRTKESQFISQFEQDVADIEQSFAIFENSVRDLDNLTERLKNLKLNFEISKCNTPLRERKNSCIRKMNDLEIKIQTKIKENILLEENLLQVKYNLEVIRKNILKDDAPLGELSNKLNSIKIELHQMNDLNTINLQQRANLLQELVELEKNLTLKNYSLNKYSRNTSPSEPIPSNNKSEKSLLEIEQNMKRLNNEVQTFLGTTKDHTFSDIDKGINKLIRQLDDMNLSEGSSFHDKKVKLLKELNHYSKLLVRRAENIEQILQFERELEKVMENSSKFTYNYINGIIRKLNDLDVAEAFAERKMKCVLNFREILDRCNVQMTTPDFSSYEREIVDISREIDHFSEATADTSFLEIEKILQKLYTEIQNIKATTESNETKSKLLRQIESLRIFSTNKAKENTIFLGFMNQLDEIRNDMNTATNGDIMTKILNILKFIQADAETASLSEKLKNDIQRKCTLLIHSCSEKLSYLSLTNYIGSENFLRDLEKNKASYKRTPSNFSEQFENLAQKIVEMEAKVQEITENEISTDYKKLEDELLKINVEVKKLNDLNNSENTRKKLKLKERVVNCLTKLDEKVQDLEYLEEVENELDILGGKLQGHLSGTDRDKLDEKLISFQLRLCKINHPKNIVSERKNEALKKLLNLTKSIKQQVSNSNTEEDSGTSI